MNQEIFSIISRIETVNTAQPWFGRAIYKLLVEVDPKKAFDKPGGSEHSMVELLYHMNAWADFTLKRLQKDEAHDMSYFEELDWRKIDLKKHSWKSAVTEFKSIHKKIIAILKKKDDTFLKEIVDYRKYNYRFLLNGFIEHNIYHIGQIAYINKMLG
jgi:uncharacterized damage-inducible protein DinB